MLVYLIATYSQTIKTSGVLGREEWIQVHYRIEQLLETVQKPAFKKSLTLAHTAQAKAPEIDSEEEVDESTRRNFDIERQVFPSLSNFIESLHDQLWKAFHAVAPHSIEYLQRIQDENKILFLCDSLLDFFKEVDQVEYQARVALIKIVYLYYKSDTIYE